MSLDLPRRLFLQAALAASAGFASATPRRPKRNIENGTPFLLDGGRILIEAAFTRPDGSTRSALAFFNMGMARTVLAKELHAELGLDRGALLRYATADAEFAIGADAVDIARDDFTGLSLDQMFGPRKVEAILILDYARRRIAIEEPGKSAPLGVAIPIELNSQTGLASAEIDVGGKPHAFVVDAGSGYCWMRGLTLKEWLAAAPEWRRAEGAIGRANYNMIDFAFEKHGTVARVPEMRIGAVALGDVGILGTGPLLGNFTDSLVGEIFWDNWQQSAPKPVTGWLGANALQHFRLTIDYQNRVSYWLRQSAPDPHDLDQPGLTLVRRDGRFFVGGLVRPVQGEALTGVNVGDELAAVGGLDARTASKEAVLAALHARPGERRTLILRRDGAEQTVDAPALDLS